MLVTTPELGQYISGAILFEETLYQTTSDGRPFVYVLKQQGIIPGIKVDGGTQNYANGLPREKVTLGLDGLDKRLRAYRKKGVQFTKWRAIFSIGDGRPSHAVTEENARRLAEYAVISQSEGFVPIVEPEVLMDGAHGIQECYNATARALHIVFTELIKNHVDLAAMVLKPNMVVPGRDNTLIDPTEIAMRTVEVMQNYVPRHVPGIAFLSGGLSDEDATGYLSEMNRLYVADMPWNLTFSFSRGLQREPLRIFAECGPDNVRKAQEILLRRAKETSLATLGRYQF